MERSAFLGRVRARLGRSDMPAPSPTPRWEPPRALFYPSVEERTLVYMKQSTAQGAKSELMRSRVEAIAAVRLLLQERGWSRVAADPDLHWPGVNPAWLREAADAEFGLCEADWAIAETGTVVLLPGGARARTTSLLPDAVGFLVPRSRILSRFTEWARNLSAEDLPACVNLISGPSRTADIELDLCIGVHGPGEVYVWVIEGE